MSSFSKFLKKILILSASLSLCVTAIPPHAFARGISVRTTPIPPAEFEDVVKTSPAPACFSDVDMNTLGGKAAQYLCEHGVIGGFPDGTHRPNQELNRAELTKFALRAKYSDIPERRNNGKFWDVLEDQWYTDYVIRAAELGIVVGYSDGSFRPNQSVTVAEGIKIIAETYGLSHSFPYDYEDVDNFTWYSPYAGLVKAYNLLPQRNSHFFQPERHLTREDMAIILYQLLLNWEHPNVPEDDMPDDVDPIPLPPLPDFPLPPSPAPPSRLVNQPPVINSVGGPTSLKQNETGTWEVRALDPENGSLRYSITWGDEGFETTASRAFMSNTFTQIFRVTHSYSRAGTYFPTFTVTDEQGLSAGTSISVRVESDNPPPASGQILFTISSLSKDIEPGTEDVSFGILTITNGTSEPILTQDGMTFVLHHENTESDEQAASMIADLKLVDINTGNVFFGPDDPVVQGGKVLVRFHEEDVLEGHETLNLDIEADLEDSAEDGTEFFWELDMSSVAVEGIYSGEITTGGPDGDGPYTILPLGNPETATFFVQSPTLQAVGIVLPDNTYGEGAENVMSWKGTFRCGGDMIIRRVDFQNTGTATDQDVDSFSLLKQNGSILTLLETRDMRDSIVGFSDLDQGDGRSGVSCLKNEEVTLLLTADIAIELPERRTLSMGLEVENLDADTFDGDPVTILNTTNIPGPTHTLVASTNTITVKQSSNQPTVLEAGNEKDIMKFTFFNPSHPSQDMLFQELVVEIKGTGAACIDEGDDDLCDDGGVVLYNGDNRQVATGTLISGDRVQGKWRFIVNDEVDPSSETYRIKADMITDGDNDALKTVILVPEDIDVAGAEVIPTSSDASRLENILEN